MYNIDKYYLSFILEFITRYEITNEGKKERVRKRGSEGGEVRMREKSCDSTRETQDKRENDKDKM